MSGRENLLAYDVDDNLAFQGVALFLATVVTPLFFWGRSIGLSVASTKTTVQSVSLTSRRLGRLNAPERLRVSSTCVIIRSALDSCSELGPTGRALPVLAVARGETKLRPVLVPVAQGQQQLVL